MVKTTHFNNKFAYSFRPFAYFVNKDPLILHIKGWYIKPRKTNVQLTLNSVKCNFQNSLSTYNGLESCDICYSILAKILRQQKANSKLLKFLILLQKS